MESTAMAAEWEAPEVHVSLWLGVQSARANGTQTMDTAARTIMPSRFILASIIQWVCAQHYLCR
jgi:hypothetical protein